MLTVLRQQMENCRFFWGDNVVRRGAGFVALGGASLVAEERGVAKPRGRGLGRRNIE